LPDQPVLEATAETVEIGRQLYAGACQFCHGSKAVTRFGGSVPDLRYATKETHATWHGIVIGGSKSASGMPAIELEIEESEAIRSYVLSLSEKIRSTQDSN
jgi:mono/diheme cytochrome c family protein